MWICFIDAFISVVAAGDGRMKIRARNGAHLTTLFPGCVVEVSDVSDYGYRTFVTRDEFVAMITGRAEDLRHEHFKRSVSDDELYYLYLDFWHMHKNYQDGGYKNRDSD